MAALLAAEDRWLFLPSDGTATIALDRSSIIQGRQQKLWVRVTWAKIRDNAAYSDWLENFDCATQSSFPSRIIDYAADGTVLRELDGDEDLMSIFRDADLAIVHDVACGAGPSSGARSGS
ncbi:hypothetical protein [Sphingomonas sp. NIBR02145]|uniref:hypothetical protein n=1 Tax=Sphingomonas sp. NIBR02145 TaxID=3014784 RepID=UPI0022B537B7|nr:hypothetical protein [Sphingomonas sp. NIBR02145]WHU02328.1 hypothetical protein O3305_19425 [Sphingomonas sp. NIBR02145]